MKTVRFAVSGNLCAECSLALRRFVGGMDGVVSIEAGQGAIAVIFDEAAVNEDSLVKITRDSIERLGYKINE